MEEKKSYLISKACIGCGRCETVCPKECIKNMQMVSERELFV